MNQNVILEFVSTLNRDYIGPSLAFILICTGIFFTVRLGFVPRHYRSAWKLLFGEKTSRGKASANEGMTPVQALSTAIASQVGTGNIVGVAMAVLMGGPGALFWLWVSAICGMSTNFAEATLGQAYKQLNADGHMVGGPAYYIRYGMNNKWLAIVFSVFFIMALGMIGVMVQANSISDAVSTFLPEGGNKLYIGLALAALVGTVLAGGVTSIASFAERVVPFMAGLFIIGALVFVGMHYNHLLGTFADVFRYAFTPKAGAGGIAGYSVMSAVRYGISRGLFSNEAGLGSTPHAHAIAKVNNPYEQGLFAMIGLSVNILICTLTALVILMSGILETNPDMVGITMAQSAFCTQFGNLGKYFIAIAVFFFALTTIIGWYFFAAQNVRYIFGERLIWPYRIVVMILVVIASMTKVELVWELADTFNFFIVVPNIIALLWLSPKVAKEVGKMRTHLAAHQLGKREDNTPPSPDPHP